MEQFTNFILNLLYIKANCIRYMGMGRGPGYCVRTAYREEGGQQMAKFCVRTLCMAPK